MICGTSSRRLDPELMSDLTADGFDPEQLIAWSETIGHGPERNWVHGTVLPPAPGDVRELPEHGSAAEQELAVLGMRALEPASWRWLCWPAGWRRAWAAW